jgi:hypothetical protein
METLVIWDGQIRGDRVEKSRSFKNGQVIIFDSPGLPSDEFIQFGLSVVGSFSLIGGDKERLLPINFLEKDLSLEGDTSLVFYLPREIGETDVETYCYFNSNVPFNLRAYVIKSSVTQESIYTAVEELKVTENLSDLAIVTNQLQQNIALGILGASLSPLTLGASALVEAPLLTGSSALSPLLLPAL